MRKDRGTLPSTFYVCVGGGGAGLAESICSSDNFQHIHEEQVFSP